MGSGRFLKEDTENAKQLKIPIIQKSFFKKEKRQDTDERKILTIHITDKVENARAYKNFLHINKNS